MAYNPTDWKNREVERPRTFTKVDNPDGTFTLIPAEGHVAEPGTPIMAVNMNKIEDALVMLDDKTDNMYELTDGPYAKAFVGDLNNLLDTGIYACYKSDTLNLPDYSSATSPWFIQVFRDGKGIGAIQTAVQAIPGNTFFWRDWNNRGGG